MRSIYKLFWGVLSCRDSTDLKPMKAIIQVTPEQLSVNH